MTDAPPARVSIRGAEVDESGLAIWHARTTAELADGLRFVYGQLSGADMGQAEALAALDARVAALEAAQTALESRVGATEADVADVQGQVAALADRVTALETAP